MKSYKMQYKSEHLWLLHETLISLCERTLRKAKVIETRFVAYGPLNVKKAPNGISCLIKSSLHTSEVTVKALWAFYLISTTLIKTREREMRQFDWLIEIINFITA